METPPAQPLPPAKPGLSTRQVLLIILGGVLLVSALVTAAVIGWFHYNFNPAPMQPVVLSEVEKQVFNAKLSAFGDPALTPVTLKFPASGPASAPASSAPSAAPAPAVPAGLENKTIVLTEREVNAYLAAQNLGENIQVSFGEGRVITAIIVEMPPDFPILPGQKLRARITFGTGLTPEHKLSLVFNDLNVGGISLPNAWLGDLKGVDLVAENLQHDPALQRFLSGIRSLEIHPEGARLILNE
jgi:hypothetical protein